MMSNETGANAGSNGDQFSTDVPDFTAEQAEAFVMQTYGIAGTAELLTSERDENFRLKAAGGESYLLKISNPSEAAAIVALQTACLDHIANAAPACPVPRVLRTTAGASGDHMVLANGQRCAVRLLTYLEGEQARSVTRGAAHRAALGTALAELDLAMRDFSHPAASHDLLWNVARADQLAHLADEISGDDRRAVVRHFMTRFSAEILPALNGLRAQVIHNDYHLHNVLVDAADPARVTGIIDFGDMIHAPLVGEVATAAAYHMADTADPLVAPAEFVAAYHQVMPLLPEEQEVVADLMMTRHLITVLISEWRATLHPENRAYIMRHNPAAWQALFQMADHPRHQIRDRLLAGIRSGDER
jgi:hydroxylysine kinase